MTQKQISVLIVDDEPFARDKIRNFLNDEVDFEVIGECGNGRQAVEVLHATSPDVLFLDIQMPEMNGFEVLQNIDLPSLPLIIFVTAFDEFAINAFEIHALDYLLKPFDYERFQKTLDRIRKAARTNGSVLSAKLEKLLEQIESKPKYLQRLMIKARGDIYFLKTDEIDWIEASGNYITIYSGKKTHLLRESLSSIAEKLNPEQFARIHRSQIVNIERIEKLNSDMHGEYIITLKNGKALVLSRTFRDNLLRHFDGEQ